MKSWFKKQMAVLLTLVLAFSVTIPVSAEGTDESVQTVTVTLSGQAGGVFLQMPKECEISSDEAENYGFTDTTGGVTTLDALVYLHELVFGTDFTKDNKDNYLSVSSTGGITKIFGETTYNCGFSVNGISPNDGVLQSSGYYGGYTVQQALLKDNDNVEFHIYQDSAALDYYSWFEQDGNRVDFVQMEENKNLNLCLKGYSIGYHGCHPIDDIQNKYTNAIEDAQLTLLDENGNSTDIAEAITDENGNVTIAGLKKGSYILSAYVDDDEAPIPILLPICKIEVTPDIKDVIASNYTEADDAWTMLEMVQAGYKNKLTKIDDFVASAAATISASTAATDIEKSIIALNALGYDVKNMNINGIKVDAVEKLTSCNMSSSSPAMFALIAVDAGNFDIPSGKCTRESLVKNLLSLQTKDHGWTWMPLSEDPEADIDMTGMALAAFAPYYLASDAESAGLTEDTYNNVKSAVDAAIDTLSKKQGANGSYGNTDTDAWVIVGLSSIGIDANANDKFIKNGHGLYDGMFEYVLDDFSGFGWTNNKELNAFATNDAFRALIAYSNMKATGKAYNVYAADSSKATTPIIANTKTITVGENFTVDTDILLENVTNKEVAYRTTNKSMAEVTTQGVVTAKKSGTVVIVATSKEDETRKVLYYVTIKDKPKDTKPTTEPSSEPKKDDPTEATTEVTTEATTEAPAKVNYSKIPLQTGKKTNVIQINDGKTKIKKAKVNNKKIVSVTVKNGKLQIKAKKKGKAVITITDENGQVSKVTVEVKKSVPLKKLSLNKKKVTLKVNQKEKLVVTKNPVTAVTKLKWSTSDKKIATVDQNGKVKAKKKGKVTITVKASNGKKARCKVTVK